VREFGFEVALCAHLEARREAIVSRQLGAGVADPGGRILDTVLVEPGPAFDDRAAITDSAIPAPAIESDVGAGQARYWKDAMNLPTERAAGVIDRAVDIGFFERERRGGRTYVRQTARYPEEWFGRIVGIEHKPDLGRPGALQRQLRTDVSLAVCDAVILATESHVTGAHRNRLPDAVGLWRIDPERLVAGDADAITVRREPTPLATDAPGIEPTGWQPGRTDIAVVSTDAKARRRRRVAERAYGKGWRTFDVPGCERCRATTVAGGTVPDCEWKGRMIEPAVECGPECDGFTPGEPPAWEPDTERAAASIWRRDPEGRARRQVGLARFGDGRRNEQR
jgi:hypothetical protein